MPQLPAIRRQEKFSHWHPACLIQYAALVGKFQKAKLAMTFANTAIVAAAKGQFQIVEMWPTIVDGYAVAAGRVSKAIWEIVQF